jgi:branched-chain amino acid transport system permease protein
LRKTAWGRSVRAVASDRHLAEALGLSVEASTVGAMALGSASGGVAMILLSIDTGLTPSLGLDILFIGVATVVAAGATDARGLLSAGIGLALVRECTGWWLTAYWQDAVVFAILIGFLLMRPQGVFGRAHMFAREY